MNERIRELWRQAVLNNAKTPMNFQDAADEFAHLIVQECAKEAFDFWSNQVDSNEESAQWHIKQHFGVE